jgi:hypothetical protein
MKEEMRVRVDQSGHQGCVAEIDDFCSNGTRDGRSSGSDSLAFNKNFAGNDDFTVGNVEHASRVEHDRGLWRGLG